MEYLIKYETIGEYTSYKLVKIVEAESAKEAFEKIKEENKHATLLDIRKI